MSNVTEQSFSASPSARAFTIRTLETSALKFSTTLTLLLSSWNTITGSVGISTKKMKWKSENGESPYDKNTHSTKMRVNYFRFYKQWLSLLAPRYNYDGSSVPRKCHVPNAFKWIGYFSWAVTRVDCISVLFQSVIPRQSSLGLAGLERANEPRREPERGTSVCLVHTRSTARRFCLREC